MKNTSITLKNNDRKVIPIIVVLSVAVPLAVAALIVGPLESLTGKTLAGLAACAALVSFGPQKYFDAQFPLIWPSVIIAQIAALALVLAPFQKPENRTAA